MVGMRLLVIGGVVLAGCGRLGFSDAGPGASSRDAAIDGSSASSTTILFSDGFEDAHGGWTYTTNATRQSDTVHRGTGALETGTSNGAASSSSQAYKQFTQVGIDHGVLAARAWFYLPSGTAQGHIDLVRLSNATSPPNYGEATIVLEGGLNLYRNGPSANGSSSESKTSSSLLPTDQWTCLEIDVDVESSGGSLDLSCNNRPIAHLASSFGTQVVNGFIELDVGQPFVGPEQTAGAALFVDDVAVGTGPIGCDDATLPACP